MEADLVTLKFIILKNEKGEIIDRINIENSSQNGGYLFVTEKKE